jgi:hypothetical protein
MVPKDAAIAAASPTFAALFGMVQTASVDSTDLGANEADRRPQRNRKTLNQEGARAESENLPRDQE